jgi:hypothetical protein
MLKATLQYCCIFAEKDLKENHTHSSSSAPVQSAGTGKCLPAIQGEERGEIMRLGDTLAVLTNEERGGDGLAPI